MESKLLPPLVEKLFPKLRWHRWGVINLENIADELGKLIPASDTNPFLDPDYCDRWKQFVHRLMGVDYSYGGYMENRERVWRTRVEPGWGIHLGVDFYVPTDMLVVMPTTAELVCSRVFEPEDGGWGGRLVFRRPDGNFFLMAHLKNIVKKEGCTYHPGDAVGVIAEPAVNGGWSPHLHLQCMRRFDEDVDGYTRMYDGIEQDYPDPLKAWW